MSDKTIENPVETGMAQIVRLADREVYDCGQYPYAVAVSHVAKLREQYPHHNYAVIA